MSSSVPRRLLLSLYPPDGGAARHVIDLASGLDPNRWRVDLACPPGSDPWLALDGRTGVELHPLTPGRDPAASDALDLRRILALARRADVIHAHSSKAGFLARFAAALLRRRRATVFTPHGWSFWSDERRSRLWLALERRAAHWCRIIVAVAAAEREAGLAAGVGSPEQYRVITNGIDPGFAPPRRPERGRILLVGRLAPPKRPDVAVRALAEVRLRRPEARLDLVAHGPLERQTEALVAELGLGDVVRLLGKRDDVPELLAQADCFLLTSDHEGCPYTVLEAMAAGVPVVASRVGGIPELVADGEAGLLFDAGDASGAAAALERVLASHEYARALGEAGRERLRLHFGRDRMLRETLALYDSLL